MRNCDQNLTTTLAGFAADTDVMYCNGRYSIEFHNLCQARRLLCCNARKQPKPKIDVAPDFRQSSHGLRPAQETTPATLPAVP